MPCIINPQKPKNDHWRRASIQKGCRNLPEQGKNTCPGLELVGSSRASKSTDFAYGNKLQDLSKQELRKNCTTKANDARMEFLWTIEGNAAASEQITVDMITTLDEPNQRMMKTYEGGCAFLLRWYHRGISFKKLVTWFSSEIYRKERGKIRLCLPVVAGALHGLTIINRCMVSL